MSILCDRRLLTLAFASALLALSVAPARAALEPEQIFDKVAPSIVLVLAQSQDTVSQGSGVVIAPQRVITNCHVIAKRKQLTVKWGELKLAASIDHEDSERDLCRLFVPDLQAPTVAISRLATVRVGQRVYAVGNPEGLELTLTEGLISAVRKVGAHQLVQTSAAYAQGSSGGGLFDLDGRLIAITSSGMKEGLGLNFAIPAEYIFDKTNEPVTTATLSPTIAPQDTTVAKLTENFPRRLTGEQLVNHFKRFSKIEVNRRQQPVYLTFYPGGRIIRWCPGCRITGGDGNLTLLPKQDLVCFKWYLTTYPDDGCFRLIETSKDNFSIRPLHEDTTMMYYTLGPSRFMARASGSTDGADRFPRALTGAEIIEHYSRYPLIEANRHQRFPFTLKINPRGTVIAECAGCRIYVASGSMSVKKDRAQVCFQWIYEYPVSGCFRVFQMDDERFEVRDPREDSPVMEYSVTH